MTEQTRWIVGSAVAVVVSVVGSAVAVVAVMGRLDRIETRMDGFDTRLRAVEIAFGKVDQRLATLERLQLPAPGSTP